MAAPILLRDEVVVPDDEAEVLEDDVVLPARVAELVKVRDDERLALVAPVRAGALPSNFLPSGVITNPLGST